MRISSPRFTIASALVAVLVLAFALPAQAKDSSGIQYEDSLQSPCGEAACPGGSLSGSGSGSTDRSGNSGGSADEPSATPEDEIPAAGGSAGGKDEGKNRDSSRKADDHPSKKADKDDGKSETSVAGGAPADDDDGSGDSPLVPILIAVAVLAAISVGWLLYRRRNGAEDGEPTNPGPAEPGR